MTAPGPPTLGRGVVVDAGDPRPTAWGSAEVVVIDEAALSSPEAVVMTLHGAWARRRPLVVVLEVDPTRFRQPDRLDAPVWSIPPEVELWQDRLHFLVWANTYDARGGREPTWWWTRKALRLGARQPVGGPGDVVLPDGAPAWIDGGPRRPWAPAEVDGLAVVHRETVEAGRLRPAPPPREPRADLAPDQLAGVSHGAGPARILAPAGSGKTRVLTERLRHLVVDRGYEQGGVLAVAFNKKAQEELEERCADFRPRARTLNSLALWLLTEARGRGPEVLEEREVRRILDRLVPARRRRTNTDPVAAYIEALSAVRLGLRDPAQVEASRDDVPGLAEAFEPYREELRRRGAVDFDEQIYGALEALVTDGAFRRRMQAQTRHLLVDELQDLTPAHVLLVRLLAAPGFDVFGVGDDDQVIYGHAGADPRFLIDFEALFPGAVSHPLEVNYRCPEVVVAAAATLLSYNNRRVDKVIHPGPGAAPEPSALAVTVTPADASAGALVSVVQGWLAGGADPSSAAVLTRVNSLLLAPHLALSRAGVPLDSVLRPDVLGRTGLRAALAYLRIAVAPDDGIARSDLVEILRRPSRGLPQWFPDRLERRSHWSVSALARIGDRMSDKDATKLAVLVGDLELLRRSAGARGATTRSLLEVVSDRIGLGSAMSLLDGSRAGEGASHLDDLEALGQVADLHPDPAGFEAWLRDSLSAERSPGGVTLSTIHRVKGREWDHVALYGVTAGLMPHRLADDVEEERRVLHVGLTRCRRSVTVLTDETRLSPFVAELAGLAPHRAASTAVRAPGRRPAPRTAPAETEPLGPEAAAAEAALRAWRTARCRRDKVPPYVVLNDRHLRGIAVARPRSLADLRRAEGIGPTKLEAYGEEILEVLAGIG